MKPSVNLCITLIIYCCVSSQNLGANENVNFGWEPISETKQSGSGDWWTERVHKATGLRVGFSERFVDRDDRTSALRFTTNYIRPKSDLAPYVYVDWNYPNGNIQRQHLSGSAFTTYIFRSSTGKEYLVIETPPPRKTVGVFVFSKAGQLNLMPTARDIQEWETLRNYQGEPTSAADEPSDTPNDRASRSDNGN